MKMSNLFCKPGMSCFLIISTVIFPVGPVQVTMNGPSRSVTAFLNEDVVLRCHLFPRTSAQNMEIKWFRSSNASYVHLFHSGKDYLEKQQPEYQGRTEFLKDGISSGKIALRIFNVSLFDEGQYHCSVRNGSFHQEALLDMKVAASGPTPLISIEGYQDKGLRVICRSSGWYPKPEVLWKDPTGRHLPSLAINKSLEANGLFEVQSDVLLTANSNQNMTCVVRNPLVNQEKQSSVYIADNVFRKVCPWIAGLCVSLVALLFFIIFALYLFDKNRKLAAELSWRNMVVPIEKANITLDPDTANHDLILSADRKNVIQGFMWHRLPENRERFDIERCVLGRQGFFTGRHYWEVEVGAEGYWAVGVARYSVRRKGRLSLDPDEGIWAVEKCRLQYQALTVPETPLSLRKKPTKIGIYLDYEMEQVAFHDVHHKTPVFTFSSAAFRGEMVFPFLLVGVGCWLTLCP